MTASEVEQLVVEIYRKWKEAGWRNGADDASLPEVLELYDKIGEQLPGRNLARPIKIRVLPKVLAPVEVKPVIHIISRHGLILGRCLQGRPHTWPAHHWTVPWGDGRNANCPACKKLYNP